MKLISVIVVTWNSSDFIYDCLNSVLEKSSAPLEIFVIDNNSADDTVEIVSENFPEVKLVENEKNLGFTFATNQGLTLANGDFLLLLNPDTEITDRALEKLADFLDKRPDAGAVGPQLLNFDDSIQPSCRSFPCQRIYLWEFSGLSRLFPHHKLFSEWKMGYFDHKTLREVDQPMGACLMIKRDALNSVGLLDRQFYMFYSEVDLCYRLRQNGWKIYFYPDATVYHHMGASVKKAKIKMILSTHKSAYQFLKKHNIGWKGTLYPIGFLIMMSAYLRIIVQTVKYGISRNGRF